MFQKTFHWTVHQSMRKFASEPARQLWFEILGQKASTSFAANQLQLSVCMLTKMLTALRDGEHLSVTDSITASQLTCRQYESLQYQTHVQIYS